jgi:hypothetical protein
MAYNFEKPLADPPGAIVEYVDGMCRDFEALVDSPLASFLSMGYMETR